MPSGLGKAGGILNIISASLISILFIVFALIFVVGGSWGLFILFIALLVVQILSFVFSIQFLKGKDNKTITGVFGILSGSLLGAIFVFVS